MRLKKYLPDFVSNIKEFQELDKTISLEVDELRNKLQQLQENQFIETANEEGLRKYEQLLNLSSTNDIELRRFNILNKYNSTIPFSIMWLRNTLNTTIGRGDFLMELDNSKYVLTIGVVKNKEHLIDSLKKDLRKKIPANMVLNINVLSPIEDTLYTGFYVQIGDKINI
nr:putative phage tail protein [uncultured Cellulosilyticum sp.]